MEGTDTHSENILTLSTKKLHFCMYGYTVVSCVNLCICVLDRFSSCQMNFIIMKLEHKQQVKLLTPLFDNYGKVLMTETKCSLQFGPE